MKYVIETNVIKLDNANFYDVESVRNALNRIYAAFNRTSLTCPSEPVYTPEEVEEKIANTCVWCECATKGEIYEEECFTIFAESEYYEYFTLKEGDKVLSTEEGEAKRFSSYEEAYDEMCREYISSRNASYVNPSGLPRRYKIFRTSVSGNNSMTQQA